MSGTCHYCGAEPMRTDLAYCEQSTATPTSSVHIRRVGPEGRRLGGRAPNTVLCGADLRSGWDLQDDVPSTLARRRLVPQDQPSRVCITCADMATSLILATPPQRLRRMFRRDPT